MKNNEQIRWDKNSKSIFEKFATELVDFSESGELPANGNQDVKHSMELQKRRLEKKNIVMKYDMIPRGHFAKDGVLSKGWNDERYTSKMEYRTCRLSRNFYRKDKCVYNNKQNVVFYEIITNANNREVVEADYYNCPNCGAVSRIAVLQNGCPYCGTFFKMSDLFPKVTNFFFIKDSGGTSQEIKHSILKVIIPCILLSIIGYTIYFLCNSDMSTGEILSSVISGILGGIVAGGIIGYFLWAISKLCGIFWNALKSIPMLINTAGSKKNFVSQMQRYSPEFCYEYFSGKVVSILKMIVFTENAENLPYYIGEPVKDLFSNIIESSYAGAVALKQFYVKDDFCYVTVDVYMEDIYDNGENIYKRNDTFRIELCKNISKPINYHFSVKKIQCNGCGGSFDATKQRNCPICGKRYEIGDDDWSVLKIVKR